MGLGPRRSRSLGPSWRGATHSLADCCHPRPCSCFQLACAPPFVLCWPILFFLGRGAPTASSLRSSPTPSLTTMTSGPLRRKRRPSEGDLLSLSSLNLQPYQPGRLPSCPCFSSQAPPCSPRLTAPPPRGCGGRAVLALREPREPVSSSSCSV